MTAKSTMIGQKVYKNEGTDQRRQVILTSSHGEEPEREYRVTYLADSPERAEAVSFFGQLEHGLFPQWPITDAILKMSLKEAQEYLDRHPSPEQWKRVTIDYHAHVRDEDLLRLKYIPELTALYIHCNQISDKGIDQLLSLPHLENLLIYSRAVSDACLKVISELKTLKMLDMQDCLQVSPDKYSEAIRALPNLTHSYSPRSAPSSEKARSLSQKLSEYFRSIWNGSV
ncbi:MAG: hypothetical protein P1V97_37660 [Planctomycetota bacterium]|nr:hypothetical protein [Planctomycetota bacterium]